jgi:hypothetical protein
MEDLLSRQSGVVSRQQALRYVSDKVLSSKVSSGRWQAPHRGVYVTHNGPLTATQQLWVASLAVGAGVPALLGGLTALTVRGLQRFTSPHIHVLLPARRRCIRPPAGVLVHRTRVLRISDVCQSAPPTTTAARSVVDAASWARSDAEARTIVAISFQQGLVVGDQVERALRRNPGVRRHALIRRTAADASGGSHSLAELDLVTLCRRAALPVPTRQVFRPDAAGRPRYLDAIFEPWGVRVEVDGAHHMAVDQWWSDMRRHNDLARRGEVLLRFPAWLVHDRPAEVAATIRDALREAGWK